MSYHVPSQCSNSRSHDAYDSMHSGYRVTAQGVFALIAPGRVVPNLVAGAIAEAGAQQAGDMMQDFKTAHLLGVCPRAQFYAMLIGSAASVFVSVAAYALYTSAFVIPGPEFPAPTAQIWLDMAELVCTSGPPLSRLSMGFARVGPAVVSLKNFDLHASMCETWCGTSTRQRVGCQTCLGHSDHVMLTVLD